MNILKAMNGMHAEQCLLERLQHLCIQKYAKYETLALSQVDVQLGDKEGEAGQHLSCTISGALKGTVKSSKNLQLQNLLLQRCESASLPVPPPSPGVSSLPRDALQRSVRWRNWERMKACWFPIQFGQILRDYLDTWCDRPKLQWGATNPNLMARRSRG